MKLVGFAKLSPERRRELARLGGIAAAKSPKPRGLAAVPPERRREISAMGGTKSQQLHGPVGLTPEVIRRGQRMSARARRQRAEEKKQ